MYHELTPRQARRLTEHLGRTFRPGERVPVQVMLTGFDCLADRVDFLEAENASQRDLLAARMAESMYRAGASK